jgi:hypothetical protein
VGPHQINFGSPHNLLGAHQARIARREKPNANTIALEGMILFTNNKTLHWLDNLDVEKKSSVKDGSKKDHSFQSDGICIWFFTPKPI